MDAYPGTAANTQVSSDWFPILIAITNGSRGFDRCPGALLPNGLLAPLRPSLQAGSGCGSPNRHISAHGLCRTALHLCRYAPSKRARPACLVRQLSGGLVRGAADNILHPDAKWHDYYGYFPWEDCAPTVGARRHRQPPAHLGKLGGHAGRVAKELKRIHLCWGGSGRKTGRKNTFCNAEMLCKRSDSRPPGRRQTSISALTGRPCATTTAVMRPPCPACAPKSNTAP